MSEAESTLAEIRGMMERSSRFISLSGYSGIFAGIYALIGAAFAYNVMGGGLFPSDYQIELDNITKLYLVGDAFLVLIASIATGIWFTTRKAKKKNLPIWDSTTRRLLINLMMPLITGGLFCLILIYHNLAIMLAPAMLIFYGLALVNASKYTFHDIRYLGILEVLTGLLSAWKLEYGLAFWAFGFGVLHICYGIAMQIKYK